MEKKQAVQNWLESATKNVEVANDMYRLEHFNWCLFMWHLAIEKSIKANLAKQDKEIPYIHNLVQLVRYAELDLYKLGTTSDELIEITTFNLEARYEDYKFEFYKKATQGYADKWVPICESIYKKIIDLIHQ